MAIVEARFKQLLHCKVQLAIGVEIFVCSVAISNE
jgi:hypothetical protein